ncbi:MAG: hypothetical protein ABH969_06325 [Pseudomonadota bacterium]
MNIPQQPLIEAQGCYDVRLFPNKHLVFQPESADARFSRIRFNAEEHTRLQGYYDLRGKIGDPRRLPGVGSRTVSPREVIGIRVGLGVVQVFADVPICLSYLRLGTGIE